MWLDARLEDGSPEMDDKGTEFPNHYILPPPTSRNEQKYLTVLCSLWWWGGKKEPKKNSFKKLPNVWPTNDERDGGRTAMIATICNFA